MKSKTLRKLIPAILIMLISAAMVATSTYAWFSMNNKVTVTGMTITTRVDESLLIATDEVGSTARQAEENFVNTVVQPLSSVLSPVLLEPVSTVDGVHFFYTDKQNVKGNGDAMRDIYVPYDPTNTTDFNKNYHTVGAVGYVDYAFQLKAANEERLSEIRLVKMDLTYGGNNDKAGTAYRAAMFVEDITDPATPSGNVGTLVTLFRPEGATNHSGDQAVNSVSTTGAVTYCSSSDVAKIPVVSNTIRYYKVVVRLWLEGEDTTCNNSTYIRFNDKWKLDLEFNILPADDTPNSVVYINQKKTEAKLPMTTDEVILKSEDDIVIVNDVPYYPVKDKKLGGTEQIYVMESTPLTPYTRYFTINDEKLLYMVDVSNAIQFNPTQVDSTYLKVTVDGSNKMSNGKTADSFAWVKDGAAIDGATGATYVPTTSGVYHCYITADDGKVYTTAKYTVVNADTLTNGDIVANLNPATSYSWKKADAPTDEIATAQKLTVNVAASAGTYYCEIVKGGSTYYTVPVTVVEATESGNQGTVTEGEGHELTNGAVSSAYAWKKVGGDITGETTGATYTATVSGDYYCVVTGTDGKTYRTAVVGLTVE